MANSQRVGLTQARAAPIAGGTHRVAVGVRMTALSPWLFLAPALGLLALYLVYPALATLWFALHDRAGQDFVGAANFAWAFHDPGVRRALANNLLWLLVVPATSTALGLLAAALTERLRWGGAARTLILMPVAISFVGAAVVWRFVYDFRPEGAAQTGLLNALVVAFGGTPRAWIALPFWNSFFLMAIVIWVQTGFAMVILAAALRGIGKDTVEAARLDGANGLQIFAWIVVPQIRGTIAVVWIAITLAVLKVFDIVLAMTNGQWNTGVLANLMFDRMFRGGGHLGQGAVIALVLIGLVAPVVFWTLCRARGQGQGR
ncbi:carbohydrate ABC transporter permease [Albidovulum sediminicola]|uniref:Sugar ABC transporter permease n=1 Tax=Albidovulum sediminicola TaxID=2984331 RepID=A0ABT2YZP7_9RHOB|nr:sugar ABC transporter permease [Defluviimonas sp. WL0075]MCV2864360.1 sugar ABC transporter permease [Defluviimonas sp. WL0075]